MMNFIASIRYFGGMHENLISCRGLGVIEE